MKKKTLLLLQLLVGNELMDKRIIHSIRATPVRVNDTKRTSSYHTVPEGMVEIKGAPFNFDTIAGEPGDFYMDRYSVTNKQFYEFMSATNYHPGSSCNLLHLLEIKHTVVLSYEMI